MTTLIDLFAGMGGFTSGFNKQGYECRGYDINPYTSAIFQINRIGEGFSRDLSKLTVNDYADVVTGGPPCKPWSCLNLRRRCEFNANYGLVDIFFKTVSTIKPAAFIMENVPPVAKSPNLLVWVRKMRRRGYSLSMSTIIYSNYEAAISRKRFILVGTRDKNNSKLFFEKLNDYKKAPETVGNKIKKYADIPKNGFWDHTWPELKTIDKYKDKYNSGKYGWYKLDYDRPSPSFGNIMKTYLLHPQAGIDGFPNRVISIREAMSIMGFPEKYRFAEGMGMGMRYQMIADTVNPLFSSIAARIIREMIE